MEVRNIHSGSQSFCDSLGNFQVEVKNGELLQFSKRSYHTLRIRIANEKQPSYYVLHLEKTRPLRDVKGRLLAYQLDSLEYDKTFFNTIHGTRQGDNNAQSISLDALSKQTRERWAFQKMYDKWQKSKYVDFIFNKELVERITYLSGDDLKRFMRQYRPTYRFLRTATEYEYLKYIKDAYKQFQKQERY